MRIELKPPLSDKDISSLKAGDQVLISGKIYAARDAAHKLFGDKPPFEVKGQILFYASSTPAGSIGPTTASRMDSYLPPLLAQGLKATIGKGSRGPEAIETMKKYKAVYFLTPGGTAAALSKHIKKSRVIAYPQLGPEAVLELEVVDFPAIVAIDSKGADLFEIGKKKYRC